MIGAIAWQTMQIEAAVSSFYSFTEGSCLADENMEIVSASPGVCGSKPPLSCFFSINNSLLHFSFSSCNSVIKCHNLLSLNIDIKSHKISQAL